MQYKCEVNDFWKKVNALQQSGASQAALQQLFLEFSETVGSVIKEMLVTAVPILEESLNGTIIACRSIDHDYTVRFYFK